MGVGKMINGGELQAVSFKLQAGGIILKKSLLNCNLKQRL